MGRIRTIKPELPQSESMGRVSRDARLSFILLWTLADDAGRLRGHPRLLASLLYPTDEDAFGRIEQWLDELIGEGCIERYTEGGYQYIEICNWRKHQKIDRPSESRLPPNSKKFLPSANPREASSVDLDLDLEVDRERIRTMDRGAGGVSPHPQSPLPRTVDCARGAPPPSPAIAPGADAAQAPRGGDVAMSAADESGAADDANAWFDRPGDAPSGDARTAEAHTWHRYGATPDSRDTPWHADGTCSGRTSHTGTPSTLHRESAPRRVTAGTGMAPECAGPASLPLLHDGRLSQMSLEIATFGHEAQNPCATSSNISHDRDKPIQSLTAWAADILHNGNGYSPGFPGGGSLARVCRLPSDRGRTPAIVCPPCAIGD